MSEALHMILSWLTSNKVSTKSNKIWWSESLQEKSKKGQKTHNPHEPKKRES
jgi:hypothetical protein